MESKKTGAVPERDFYERLAEETKALLGEGDAPVSSLANTAALLWHRLPNINWVGFYILAGAELHVGPFMGQPACVSIPLGKGVCGKAAKERRTIVVDKVADFAGYIACDRDSRSEIVLPISGKGGLRGVLDIDSPLEERFGKEDATGLAAIADLIAAAWPKGAAL